MKRLEMLSVEDVSQDLEMPTVFWPIVTWFLFSTNQDSWGRLEGVGGSAVELHYQGGMVYVSFSKGRRSE